MTWGEGDVLPRRLGGGGRDFRQAGATVGGARAWVWSAGPGTRGPGGKHHFKPPLKRSAVPSSLVITYTDMYGHKNVCKVPAEVLKR